MPTPTKSEGIGNFLFKSTYLDETRFADLIGTSTGELWLDSVGVPGLLRTVDPCRKAISCPEQIGQSEGVDQTFS